MQQISEQQPKIQERILCPIHKKPILYLNTSIINQSKNYRILKCVSCISKEVSDNFTNQKQTDPLIAIEDMELEKNPYKLDSWFIKFNENQLIPLLYPNQGDFLSEFSQFLKTFRSQMNDKIDLLQEEVKKRYEEVEQNRQRIFSYTQKISYYNEIKSIIQNSSDYVTVNYKLNKVIETIKTQKPQIEKDFKTVADNFNFYSSYLNLDKLKAIQTAVDEFFENFQKVCSFEVLDVTELENNRIKPIQENPNIQKDVLIGYLIQCSSKQQILDYKDYSYVLGRYYGDKDQLNKYVITQQLYKNVF